MGALPFVMVSVEVDQRQIARAVLAGADEYVLKPFDGPMPIGPLITAVDSLLDTLVRSTGPVGR